jgi:NAD(P)-dependent dehydrogenase (short-subunit alcohol dehydrogenase family)
MLTRKNIVITGANSGIGFETVRGLYADGHNLIFGSRSEEKNREALQLIMKDNTKSIGTVKCFKLDLSKQSSIE